MATVKRSRQRDAIRSFLMSRKDHPTAEVVYDNVSKEFPNISLGTVYSREVEKNFNEAAAKNFDGTIRGNVTFFYGECPECIDK